MFTVEFQVNDDGIEDIGIIVHGEHELTVMPISVSDGFTKAEKQLVLDMVECLNENFNKHHEEELE
jgi:hypothetical protein